MPNDNTFRTASDIGLLNGTVIKSGRIGKTDAISGVRDIVDYYKFTLNHRTEFSASLVGLVPSIGENTELELFNSTFTYLIGSYNIPLNIYDNPEENVKITLDPGTYYIAVYAHGNSAGVVPNLGNSYTLYLNTPYLSNPSPVNPKSADPDKILGKYNFNDNLRGGNNNDRIFGFSGNDSLYGEIGEDSLYGSSGNDLLVGGANDDYLLGGRDNDTIYGNLHNDLLDGEEGDDYLSGNEGNDTLIGYDGIDTLVGGEGDDIYYVDNDRDFIYESENGGNDTVRSTAFSYSISEVSVENIVIVGDTSNQYQAIGNSLNNEIIGNNYANKLIGNSGNDTLEGRDGTDILDGGAGSDVMIGGHGNDIYYINNPGDVIIENKFEGNDIVFSTISYSIEDTYLDSIVLLNYAYSAIGNKFDNHLKGNNLSNDIFGGDGNDQIKSEGGNDTLDGAAGNDTLYAREGNDILLGGSGSDSLFGGQGSDELLGGLGSDYLDAYRGLGGSEYDILTGDPIVLSWLEIASDSQQPDVFVLGNIWSSYYLGDGYALIKDFSSSGADKIKVHGSISDYSLEYDSVSGQANFDTSIYFRGELIGIVEDTIEVDLAKDFSFVSY